MARRGSDGRPSARAPHDRRDARRPPGRVQAIEQASFTSPWPPHAYRSELETNRLAHYLVAEVDGRVVAYGGIWLMVDEAHVTTFAVHPLWRRRRIGERLLLALLDVARRPTRPRGDARGPAVEPRRRGGCTRSSASGPSASGPATTATTARTR